MNAIMEEQMPILSKQDVNSFDCLHLGKARENSSWRPGQEVICLSWPRPSKTVK